MGRTRFNRTYGDVGSVGKTVYRAILSRQRNGSDHCLLRHRTAYEAVAHMLQPDGLTATRDARDYASRLRALRNEIDAGPDGEIHAVLYRRLMDHLKKNWRKGRPVHRWARNTHLGCEGRFGYPIEDLKWWFELLFEEGMTWGRFIKGDIQMDHVIPARAFDLSTDKGVKAAYWIGNLQPLWRGDNLRKQHERDKLFMRTTAEGTL